MAEDGMKYVFSATETTSNDDEETAFFGEVTVAWYLTEIISAKNNEKIVLTYYHEDFGKPLLKINRLVLNPTSQTSYVIPANDINVSFNSKKLDEIILYKDNVAISKVTFEANTTRFDITSSGAYTAKALSKISVFDDPESSQPLKYFDINIENVDAIENASNERLFLRSIQEYYGNESKPPYVFEYISEDRLPSRLAYKADHWGYYSQQNGTEFAYSDQVGWRVAKSKEPSSTVEYGSLQKVTFPTGGYNIFNYENNEYKKQQKISESGKEWYDVTKELQLNWRGDAADGGGWFNYDDYEYSNYESYDFSLEEGQFVKLDMNLTLVKGLNTNVWDIATKELNDSHAGSNIEPNYKISIINTDNNNEVFIAYLNSVEGDDEINFHVRGYDWVEFDINNNNDLYSNPNDVPDNLKSLYLEYYQGHFLDAFRKQADNRTAYKTYHFEDLPDNNDIYIGGSLDRPFYLNLDEGNYQMQIKTVDIDNDMINYSSEVSVKIDYRITEEGFDGVNNNNLVYDDLKRFGNGIRVKSQIIGTEDSENIIYYDYIIHDEDGMSTAQTSAQITEEPNVIEYTPSARYYTYGAVFNPIGGANAWAFLPNGSSLQPSSLWARVGGDHPFFILGLRLFKVVSLILLFLPIYIL